MHILYITRKFPPNIGGMEKAAFELYRALSAQPDTELTLVKYSGPSKWLPLAYFSLLFEALYKGFRRRPDVIYLQDGILAPLGWFVRILLRRPTVITVHGPEIAYRNPVAQGLMAPCIAAQDSIIANSSATNDLVEKRVPASKSKLRYIPVGISDEFYSTTTRDKQLKLIARESGLSLKELSKHKLLVTSGRLVRRKGVRWLVNNVVPKLVEEGVPLLYLVAGSGKYRENIEQAILRQDLEDTVLLLGPVSDGVRDALYNVADVFVMPNVPVPGDMEGFGLVALEAATCGTLVVASKLDGIQDAIKHGKNGLLVEPKHAAEYVKVLARELTNPTLESTEIRTYTLENYSWQVSADAYLTAMKHLVK